MRSKIHRRVVMARALRQRQLGFFVPFGSGGGGVAAPAVAGSVRLRASASANLGCTLGTATDNKKLLLGVALKLGAPTSGVYPRVWSAGSDYIRFDDTSGVPTLYWSIAGASCQSSRVFRDYAGFGYLTILIDTTQATPADRVKAWWGSEQITAFSSASYPALNASPSLNSATAHYIGWGASTQYLDAVIATPLMVDGQGGLDYTCWLAKDSNGEWKPKTRASIRASVASGGGPRNGWGANGYLLPFSDTTSLTTLGYDRSQSDNDTTGNNWTANGISLADDTFPDSPVNGTAGTRPVGNYATLDPLHLWNGKSSSQPVLSDANLKFSGSGGWLGEMVSSLAMPSGDFCCEITYSSLGLASVRAGICAVGNINENGTSAGSYAYASSGDKYNGTSNSAYGATWTTADVIGIRYNNGTLTFYKNGVSQGDAFTGLSGPFVFWFVSYNSTATVNFGQRPFAYSYGTARALCSTNLPTPAVANPREHLDINLRAGTGAVYTKTGLLFKPGIIWSKNRDYTFSHQLYDIVRGALKMLSTNNTAAESTNTDSLTAFNADGYSIGANPTELNTSGRAYVDWLLNTGGSAGAVNNDGNIAATVSANQTAGISVATFTTPASTGFSFGHGLGRAPAVVMLRSRAGSQFVVISEKLSATTKYLVLNSTNAEQTFGATVWSVTATTVTIPYALLDAGEDYVAYCFAEIEGFSKFGTYAGSNTSPGPRVHTPFRPRLIDTKDMTGGYVGSSWSRYDTARSSYNGQYALLRSNSSASEDASTPAQFEIYSNGFRPMNSYNEDNGGNTYFFMAFADQSAGLNANAR